MSEYMPTVMITNMEKIHIEQVARLECECFHNPWSENALLESMQNEHYIFAVALIDSEIVGYGGMYVILDEGNITNIAVNNAYRRQGIAEKIINYLIDKSYEKCANVINLEVRESNIPAINIYTRLGFQKLGIRKKFYSNPVENAILMCKKLPL